MRRNSYMLTAEDIAQEMSCSRGHAYKLIRQLNEELKKKGFIVMAGRVPRKYWAERFYGYPDVDGFEREGIRVGV